MAARFSPTSRFGALLWSSTLRRLCLKTPLREAPRRLFDTRAYMRSLQQLESHHIWVFVILILVVIGFGVAVYLGREHIGNLIGPTLRDLESSSSP